jgi:hypothetical protein
VLARDGVDERAALSLNTAVHQRARGGGTFTRLATETIDRAREMGVRSVLGVANANSTPGFLRRLEFELLTPLPASVLLPTPAASHGIRSGWASPSTGAALDLPADCERYFRVPARGDVRRWTKESLAWRLARPGGRYALHLSPDLLAVSCAARQHGVPVAVVLKVFAPAAVEDSVRRALVRGVCRFHRAPLALHVGLNHAISFPGVPLPGRLRASPLNLIYRSLEDPRRPAAIVDFEFLDFDAY